MPPRGSGTRRLLVTQVDGACPSTSSVKATDPSPAYTITTSVTATEEVRSGCGDWVRGTVIGMATRKVTLSFDVTAFDLAERAAAHDRMSVSAWLSRAAHREALRAGYVGPIADALADALADEVELAEAERQMRAAG
jgi:hypothetical protein